MLSRVSSLRLRTPPTPSLSRHIASGFSCIAYAARGYEGADGGGGEQRGGKGGRAGNYMSLDDEALLKECRTERYRASGPGGQHRNKVETAVRLTHIPTGVVATAADSRSQHANRKSALRRLRQSIALSVRGEVEDSRSGEHDVNRDDDEYEVPNDLKAILPGSKGSQQLGMKHAEYPKGVALLLDVFVDSDYSIRDTARRIGLSTGALSKLITKDPKLMTKVNQLRQQNGLKPIKR